MGQPPKVNPQSIDFICIPNIDQLPWAKFYDVDKDGVYGLADMRAQVSSPEAVEVNLDSSCRQAKINFIREEVTWKLQDILVQRSAQPKLSLFQEIDHLKEEALRRVRDLDAGQNFRVSQKTNSAVVEMDLRVRSILNGTGDEVFGVGIGLFVEDPTAAVWRARIVNVHPASDAAKAGIKLGDVLVAINDRLLKGWSSDGTVNGLVDSKTGLLGGINGTRNSESKLTIQRGTEKLDFLVKKTIWSGRTESVQSDYRWNGKEHGAAQNDPSSEPENIGCSFNPKAKP